MKVPYRPPAPQAGPAIDPIFLAMAAADLDEAGLLYQPIPVPEPEATPDAPPSF